jgi:hypothetical protein
MRRAPRAFAVAMVKAAPKRVERRGIRRSIIAMQPWNRETPYTSCTLGRVHGTDAGVKE